MAATFDPLDRASWYFGPLSRQDATDLLMSEREGGVFLVRDSTSMQGDYVLCVKEDNKVSHYIINKVQQGEQIRYKIGDQMFADLPALLGFYKIHYLDTTPLIRPAIKRIEKVLAKYDFEGRDPDDLPFKKGEMLTIVSKDEEQWWTGMNSLGKTGSIPVPYVQLIRFSNMQVDESHAPPFESLKPVENGRTMTGVSPARMNLQRRLPAYARVKQARTPNAYDKTALKLVVGNVIKVTKMHPTGQWEGELFGKVGFFPFNHVEFIDQDPSDDLES